MFDPGGNLVKNFGRYGQGPSDFIHPMEISVLDQKYLVISEYATNMRISIFDLNGNFVRLVKTTYPIFGCTGLKKNKIAILTRKTTGGNISSHDVLIKDILTGEEKKICSFTVENKLLKIGNMMYSPGNFDGQVFIRKTGNGDLLVGFSGNNKFIVYSTEGKPITSFEIKSEPTPIDQSMIERYKRVLIEGFKRDKFPQSFINEFEKQSIARVLPSHLPYYSNLLFLGEYICVFDFRDLNTRENNTLCLYTLEGNLVCRTVLNFGSYEKNIFTPLSFFNGHLYGLFKFINDDENVFRLIRIRL